MGNNLAALASSAEAMAKLLGGPGKDRDATTSLGHFLKESVRFSLAQVRAGERGGSVLMCRPGSLGRPAMKQEL